MPSRRALTIAAVLALALAVRFVPPAAALEACRLLRQPDIQGGRIVFVYAGDLWTVARSGGLASRVTSHEGLERFPKLSPDGKSIAFTAEYDGNLDAYTVPVEGGEPTRLTWHPDVDQVAEWYPDGRSLLLRSRRASAIQRYDRFFRIPAQGGFEEMLPLPTGGYCSFSPDGGQIAFVSPSYDNRTWKRYRGGNAPEIWIYDFGKNTSEKITDWPGADEWPMWHGRTIYYCSDRGGRTANLWAYDLDAKAHRQVTRFAEYDVKWPSIGGDAIVFENGGDLYVMDLPGERPEKVQVLVPDDKPFARAEYRNVAKWTGGADLSPSGKRAVIEARGELFTVPAEKGDVRNLTNTPGARERDPAWSPDGRWIAYLSDASGEYQVHVVGSDGRTPDRQVTRESGTFRFAPRWSPDSKKLAFSDKTRTLWWCDVANGKLTRVDKSDYGEIHDYQWSGDSRWLAYSKPWSNNFNRIVMYALDGGRATVVSNGMTDDFSPTFDAEGKYLFFASRRHVDLPAFQYEYSFPYAETDKLYGATLRDTLASPAAPLSDEEEGEAKSGEAADKADKSAKGGKEAKSGGPEAAWKVELEGLGGRVAELPVPAGRYGNLRGFKGKLLYMAFDAPDPEGDGTGGGALHTFDLEKREDKTVISGIAGGYAASKDGGKVLYRAGETFGIVDAAEGKKSGDGKIAAGTLMATVDPRREWMQMFDEAWRLERDFYYDPAMGGIDWKAVGARYRQLVPFVAHRSDLNYILGELIGELSTSHTYVGGGDSPQAPHVDVGLLGADYTLDAASGRYRFATLYRERDWNSDVAAPLGEPGIGVREGDVLLAVNDRPVRAPMNLYAAFVGTAGKATRITVGKSANDSRPRTFVVKPIASEATLRYTAWVRANREKVAKATGGRIAYIHVPNTALAGIKEFTKQFYPQVDRQGIIVDERFNGGGFIPDFFVERLRRSTVAYWSTRDGDDFRTPQTALDGPRCILINQYAGSGGDAFPHYFRLAGLGPLIGKRTWGGLVGISHDLPLVDGGSVTMPDFGMWDPKSGEWVIENHGVDPDIEVENAPNEMVAGHDPQLERAIDYCLEQLETNPPKKPPRPKYKTQQ
jgi:tricorn protease